MSQRRRTRAGEHREPGRGIACHRRADVDLVDASVPDAVAAAYDRVVIGSRDGNFAARAAELRPAGVVVAVVTLRESPAIDLDDNAALVRRLPPTAPA